MFTVQPQKNFPSCNWHWRMAKLQLPGKLIYMEWLQWSRVYGALGWNLKSVFSIWAVQDEECRRTQKLRPGSRLWVPSLQRKGQAVKPGARSWGYPSQPGRSLGIGLFRVQARQLEKGTVTAELWTRLQNPGGQTRVLLSLGAKARVLLLCGHLPKADGFPQFPSSVQLLFWRPKRWEKGEISPSGFPVVTSKAVSHLNFLSTS